MAAWSVSRNSTRSLRNASISERGCSPLRALTAFAHLRTEECFFRGTCPRKKRNLILFRHLRMTELCEALACTKYRKYFSDRLRAATIVAAQKPVLMQCNSLQLFSFLQDSAAQVSFPNCIVIKQISTGTSRNSFSGFQYISAVCNAQRHLGILFNQQNSRSCRI